MSRRAAVAGLVFWLILGVATLKALTWPIFTADEAWFVQVLHRITSGDVLYRDVFFGALPLSIYLVAPLAALFGAEVLVVRGVAVLCFMLVVIVCDSICRRLHAEDSTRVLLAVGLLAFALPAPLPPYAPLATLLLLGSLWATLVFADASSHDRPEWKKGRVRVAALAGALAGLSFCAKQNVGALALGALLLALLRLEGGAGRSASRPAAAALAAFMAVAAALLVPVYLTGGLAQFWDYAFLNKMTYLRLSRISYADGLKAAGNWLFGSSPSGAAALTFLVAPLALAALLVAWLRGSREGRHETEVVFLYGAAATVAIFPRADYLHVAFVLPVLLVALAQSWQQLFPAPPPHWMGPLAWSVGIFLCGVVGNAMLVPINAGLAGALHPSSIQHFRGVLVSPRTEKPVEDVVKGAARLPAEARDQGILILSVYASLSYLVTGTRNPTPYDYPLVTAFGRSGESEVISALSAGRIRLVCLDPGLTKRATLKPERLLGYVQEAMEPVGEAGLCTLYGQRAARASAASGGREALSSSGS